MMAGQESGSHWSDGLQLHVALNYFFKVDSHRERLSNPVGKSDYLIADSLIFMSQIDRSCHPIKFYVYHLLPEDDLRPAVTLYIPY